VRPATHRTAVLCALHACWTTSILSCALQEELAATQAVAARCEPLRVELAAGQQRTAELEARAAERAQQLTELRKQSLQLQTDLMANRGEAQQLQRAKEGLQADVAALQEELEAALGSVDAAQLAAASAGACYAQAPTRLCLSLAVRQLAKRVVSLYSLSGKLLTAVWCTCAAAAGAVTPAADSRGESSQSERSVHLPRIRDARRSPTSTASRQTTPGGGSGAEAGALLARLACSLCSCRLLAGAHFTLRFSILSGYTCHANSWLQYLFAQADGCLGTRKDSRKNRSAH
jgi:hypothetical protein